LGKFIYVQAPGHMILAETSASRYPKISWYAFRRYCLQLELTVLMCYDTRSNKPTAV